MPPPPMRVLMLHNRYTIRGGEEEQTEVDCRTLRGMGYEVDLVHADNTGIGSGLGRARAALSAVYNREWSQRIERRLRQERFDILHVQNFFPLISPSVYFAAEAARVPVVQSLHNYRIACPSANFFRDDELCFDCLGKTWKWPGIVHACYRGSHLGSAVPAAMSGVHRLIGSWRNRVAAYAAVSHYLRDRMIAEGLPAERIIVKQNCVELAAERPPPRGEGKYILYVGRLAKEKGIDILLDAWERAGPPVPLKLVGEGEPIPSSAGNVEWLGRRPLAEVYELMQEAICVVMPGKWPEPFGRVAIEAFAHGTPVLASRAGALPELVIHGVNGFTFEPGDRDELARLLLHMASNRSLFDRARLFEIYQQRYSVAASAAAFRGLYEAARRNFAAPTR